MAAIKRKYFVCCNTTKIKEAKKKHVPKCAAVPF